MGLFGIFILHGLISISPLYSILAKEHEQNSSKSRNHRIIYIRKYFYTTSGPTITDSSVRLRWANLQQMAANTGRQIYKVKSSPHLWCYLR